jgi:plastocyanin
MNKRMLFLMTAALFAAGAMIQAADEKSGHEDSKTQSGSVRFTTWEVKMNGSTNKFEPDELPNVKVGDQVVFVNLSGTHTAHSKDLQTASPKNTFNTGTMSAGQRTAIFFNGAGTFEYKCAYHGTMTGKITVAP